MKISSHDISFTASHRLSHFSETKTKVTGIYHKRPGSKKSSLQNKTINGYSRSTYTNRIQTKNLGRTEIRAIQPDKNNSVENKNPILSAMVSNAVGSKISITEHLELSSSSQSPSAADHTRIKNRNVLGSVRITFTQSFKKEENEQTIVDSQGVVATQDGKEISFGLHMEMDRSFRSEKVIAGEVSVTNMMDPIVLQLEKQPLSFSDNVFSFDINNDGKEEKLSALGKGSGFLAYDINQDGIINDGTELFGTKTGNGFEELSQYDNDKNGWIDENDEIFQKLSIWRPQTDGEDEYLSGLLTSDIGAIYLGYTNSEHSVTDTMGNTLAKLNSTGVFLKKSGEASLVYGLDVSDLTEVKSQQNSLKTKTLKNKPSPSEPQIYNPVIDKLKNFHESLDMGSIVDPKKTLYKNLTQQMKARTEELMEDIKDKNEKQKKELMEQNLKAISKMINVSA